MNYGSLINEFMKSFPEFEDEAEEEIYSWHGDYLPHMFFGIVVNPSLRDKLLEDTDHELLKRYFDFFERMANSKDQKTIDVLGATVLEGIAGKEYQANAMKYMGPKTKELNKIVNR